MMLSTAYCWYLNILPIYLQRTYSQRSPVSNSTAIFYEKRENNRNFEERSYGYNTEAIPR